MLQFCTVQPNRTKDNLVNVHQMLAEVIYSLLLKGDFHPIICAF